MKKITAAIIMTGILAAVFIYTSREAKADVPFDKNNLIADSTFVNVGTMSVASIQSFLAGKGSLLANWTDNVDMYNYQRTDVNGNPCLVHKATGMSAAQIIHEAATDWKAQRAIWWDTNGNEVNKRTYTGTIGSCNEWGYWADINLTTINPQAILVTLQKEQSAITANGGYSTNPASYDQPGCCSNEYKLAWAMGYGVPDSGSKNHIYKGFYMQINYGAYQLRLNYQGAHGQAWDGFTFNPALGSCTYRVGATCVFDGCSVVLSNGATSSLYRYTPHTRDPANGCNFNGNYNFVQLFASWFAPYDYQVTNITYGRGNTYIPETEKQTMTITVKNTGSGTWSNSGPNPVRLGTWLPQRQSGFYESSWPFTDRPAILQESSVAPGSNGTFVFQVQAPAQGTYDERFNLVSEGLSWFPDKGLNIHFDVGPALFNAEHISNTLPSTMTAGSSTTVQVIYKNTSETAWHKVGSAPVKLGTQDPAGHASVFADSTWENAGRAVTMSETTVPRFANATFSFVFKAPNTPGTYTETFAPVAEGWAWMYGAKITKTITVTGTFQAQAQPSEVNVTVNAGQSTDTVVSFTNTGTATWNNSGSPQMQLSTANPNGRTSIFEAENWVAYNRPSVMNEASVPSGGTATFNLRLKAPLSAGGTYNEYFSPVAEGLTWVNSQVKVVITVNPAQFKWQLVSLSHSSGSPLMSPSQTQTITVGAKNVGNVTWVKTGSNPVRLGTWPPQRISQFRHSSWPFTDRPALMTQDSVAPGETATFTFTVQAPAQLGEYSERFNLVAEGITWMNDAGLSVYFNVQQGYKWQLVSLSHSSGSPLMSPSQTQTITVGAKNVGNVTWVKTGSNPVRLGTWPPQRISQFRHSSWPFTDRPALMTQDSVAPGETATFTFTVQAPAQLGEYSERFNLVAEGITWMNDAGLSVYFKVV